MREPIVAGNWKMNGTRGSSAELAAGVVRRLAGLDSVEVVLCPPFTALGAVAGHLAGRIELGAQNLHWEPAGAWTGEVSAAMLVDAGCRYVIVGHSERRSAWAETDEHVRRKAQAALAAGLVPIVCVGETLEQREAGQSGEVVDAQLRAGLAGLETELRRVVLAYEPVWAIGTGRTATASQAQEVHGRLRRRLAELAGAEAAGAVRILYGGSLKPSNAAELFAEADVDGGLVGGAALDAEAFASIVRAAAGASAKDRA